MREPDEPTSPSMRRVFDELEAEFEAGLRREADQETVAAVRAELGSTVLWEQLARRLGTDMVAIADDHVLRGSAVASYPEFLVLRADDGAEHLTPRSRGLGRPPGRATAATADARPGRPPVPAGPRPSRAGPPPRPGQGRPGPRDQPGRHDRGRRQRLPGARRARPRRGATPGGRAGAPVRGLRRDRRRHASSGAPMSGCLRAQSAVCSCMRSM
jgi:hypothetical protein